MRRHRADATIAGRRRWTTWDRQQRRHRRTGRHSRAQPAKPALMDIVGGTGTPGTPAGAGGKGGAVSWVAPASAVLAVPLPVAAQRRDLRHHGRATSARQAMRAPMATPGGRQGRTARQRKRGGLTSNRRAKCVPRSGPSQHGRGRLLNSMSGRRACASPDEFLVLRENACVASPLELSMPCGPP
jgi:hypothetical protein